MRKIIALVILLLVSTSANAEIETEKVSVFVMGFSHHLFTENLNETHNLIGIEYKNIFIGVFENSYKNTSAMLTHRFDYDLEEVVDFAWAADINYGFMVGAVYGYTREEVDAEYVPQIGKLSAALVPYIEYDGSHIKPNLALLGEALFLTFRIEF